MIQPGEGPLDQPSPLAQPAAMFSVALCEPRHDAAGTQTLPDYLSVITTVAEQRNQGDGAVVLALAITRE
jgi:hypothetical protein